MPNNDVPKKTSFYELNYELGNLPSTLYTVRPGDLFSFWVSEPLTCQRPTHIHNCWFKLEHEAFITLWSTEQSKQAVTNHATISGIRVLLTPLNRFYDVNEKQLL